MEVQADGVQPARFILPISILPSEEKIFEKRDELEKQATPPLPKLAPVGDQLPVPLVSNSLVHEDQPQVVLIVLILTFTVIVLVCRNRKDKKSTRVKRSATTPPRIPPSPRSSTAPINTDKPSTTSDLLG